MARYLCLRNNKCVSCVIDDGANMSTICQKLSYDSYELEPSQEPIPKIGWNKIEGVWTEPPPPEEETPPGEGE